MAHESPGVRSVFISALLRLPGLAGRTKSVSPCETAGGEPQRKTEKKSARRQLYDLHSWVGFHLAVVMFVVVFSGTFATISNELDWLTQHDMRVSPDGSEVSWQEMLDAVKVYDPRVTILGIEEMAGDHFAYRVRIFDEQTTLRFIHVNQWTGEVTGETPYFTIQRFFRDLHRHLFLPKVFGLTIVSSMAIVLGISLYTGLKTARNWRTLMTRIRFSKGARTAMGDAHKAAGLWSIWFFVLMIATGLWYYAEFLGKDFEPGRPAAVENMAARTNDVIVYPPVTEIIRVAETAYPGLDIKAVSFGFTGNPVVTVSGSAGNPIVRNRANAVYIDPVTLEVLHVRRSRDLPPVQWINQIVDPLHFGSFAGLPVKLIWFAFGLFMTGLSVSGVWLTWRRLKSRGASWMQIAALPVLIISFLFASFSFTLSKLPIFAGLSPLPYIWFITGLFLAVGALLCAVWLRRRFRAGWRLTLKNAAISLLTITMTAGAAHATLVKNPFRTTQELALGKLTDGPVQAELFLNLSPHGQSDGSARFAISGKTGRLNMKNLSVRLLKDGEPLGVENDRIQRPFRFLLLTQLAFVKLPTQQLSAATDIEATFEMNSGNHYKVTWRLPV